MEATDNNDGKRRTVDLLLGVAGPSRHRRSGELEYTAAMFSRFGER
jgi:hypothetical protein